MRKKRQKQKFEYRKIECDSPPETWTLQWLFELEEKGYVKDIKRAETYPLFAPVSRGYVERLKTKAVSKTEILLGPHVYTPDFECTLTKKGLELDLFVEIDSAGKLRKRNGFNIIHQKGKVVIETKGTSFRHEQDTTEKFKVDQKWLWEKHTVYVNLFQHDNVFPKTWTPEEYKTTPKTKQKRKINWKIRSLTQYLKT